MTISPKKVWDEDISVQELLEGYGDQSLVPRHVA